MTDISLLPNNLKQNEDEQKKQARAAAGVPNFQMHAPEQSVQPLSSANEQVATSEETAGISVEEPEETQGHFEVVPKGDDLPVDSSLKMKMPTEQMADAKKMQGFDFLNKLKGWFGKKK